MSALVNIDGRLLPPAEARVSVFDRGFLYGDSVYEVVRTYSGRPFELQAHLGRLTRSADLIWLTLPWNTGRLATEVVRTLDAAPVSDADDPTAASWNRGERTVRIVVTRGSGDLGLDPSLAVAPTTVIIVHPLAGPPVAAYRDGVEVCVVDVPRAAPTAADPSAKTGLHLPHVLAVREARRRGAYEALLTDGLGHVTEGASSNIFAVRKGRVHTPHLGAGILEGVTRGVVIRLAREVGVALEETALTVAELEGAAELFITSTAREILPVTRLGGRPVGDGRVGPVTRRLHDAFRRLAGGR